MKFIYIEGIFINVENIVSVEMITDKQFSRTKIITNNSTIFTGKYIDEVLDIIEQAKDIKDIKSYAKDDIRYAYNTFDWAIPTMGRYKNKRGEVVNIVNIDYEQKIAKDDNPISTGMYNAKTGVSISSDRKNDMWETE